MNEAVVSLLTEGKELSTLRVSEITGRAGIGKETAYEYFSSKAELIATALEYNLAKQLERLALLVEKAKMVSLEDAKQFAIDSVIKMLN